MTGYFTTEELYEKNKELSLEYNKDYEILELPKVFNKSLKPTLTMNPSRATNKDSKEINRLQSYNYIAPIVKEQKNEQKQNNSSKNLININPDTNEYNARSEEFKKKLDSVYKNQMDLKKSLNSTNTIIGNFPTNENIAQRSETKDLSKSISPSSNSKKLSPGKKQIVVQEKKNNSQIQTHFYSQYIYESQMIEYLINPKENVKQTNPNFGKELAIFNKNLEKHKRKLRILEMEKEIEFLNKKNEAIKELNKDLEEAIKHKKENLQKVTEQLKPNQVNYINKVELLKNNLNSRGEHQLIYDSFVYQKMAEVCFVFFNDKIQSLYDIPEFYNEALSSSEEFKSRRLAFYNKDKRNVSAMMGHICQLLIYLSKTFNIPLRFPIFLNGSNSYILRSVKDKIFLPLFFDPKKDDKHGNFENALNCLKDDIKEILNFLSMFPEIISKKDNEIINNMNGKCLFFFFFVVFNHSLFKFMKTVQNVLN
jgi:prefoldin subunit 5